MTVILYWERTFYSIIISYLWLFKDLALVLWAGAMKKRETHSKSINFLYITAIISIAWNIIFLFLPDVKLSYYIEPEAFELFIYGLVNFLYTFITNFLGFMLAIALTIYFYKKHYPYKRIALLGPGIFLLGHIIYFSFVIYVFPYVNSSSLFNYSLFPEYNEAYLTGMVLTKWIPLVGMLLMFFYSIYINNDLFILFCGLFFAYLLISFTYSVNTFILELNYQW